MFPTRPSVACTHSDTITPEYDLPIQISAVPLCKCSRAAEPATEPESGAIHCSYCGGVAGVGPKGVRKPPEM